MAGTVLSVLVGCLCAATLLFANSKVQQLGHASLLHLRTWTQLTDRLPPLIRGIGQSSDIPAFVEVYRQEFTRLMQMEQENRSDVDALVAGFRSPFWRAAAFIDDSDLRSFQRSDIDSKLRILVRKLLPGEIHPADQAALAAEYQSLSTAQANGELLYPLSKRVAIASEMLTRCVVPLYFLLSLIGLSVMLGIWLMWQMALLPALARIQSDATDLTAQNALLRRAEDQINAAQHAARLSYWYGDIGSDSITTVHMEKVLGLEASEVPKSVEALASISPPAEAVLALEAYRKLLLEDGAAEISRTVTVPGREPVTVRERIESLTRADGRQIMGTILDISELARANEQLARLDKVKMIEALISGIAHDFKNMLGVIQGHAELARLKPSNNHIHIDSILFAVRSADSVIQQLQMNSLDGDRKPELIAPAPCIQTVVDAMRHGSSGGNRITVYDRSKVNGSEGATSIFVNSGLFQNAILNVLKNACEAAPDGVIAVNLSTMTAGDIVKTKKLGAFAGRAEKFLCIEIADRGPGMDNAIRSRALEPFFSTKGSGRGIGLWSVYSFLKNCSGTLHIDSVPQRGTSVQLYFPIADMATPEVAAGDVANALSAPAGNILIVEDEIEAGNVLVEQLSVAGLEPVLARDADSAEKILRSGMPISAIVADINLGNGRTGLELMRQISPEFPQIKIILVSGVVANWENDADRIAKSWRLLEKPFTFKALQQTLNELGVVKRA